MSDTQDVEALVARLESLSTEERRKHGVPQDIAMHEAATALRTLAREREPGSVQIYPESALALTPSPEGRDGKEVA